jgi:hypothetical protein
MKLVNILKVAAILGIVSIPGRANFTVPTATISPLDGALTGNPGDTVQWSISFANADPQYWISIDSVQSDYQEGTGTAGEIPADDPNFFQDELASGYFLDNFVINGVGLAPLQDINVTSSPGDPVPLASYEISPDAAAGTVDGTIELSYSFWDANPFDPNGSGANQIGGEQELDFQTSVSVVVGNDNGGGNNPPQAPEPGTIVLSALGLAMAVFFRKRGMAMLGFGAPSIFHNENSVDETRQ